MVVALSLPKCTGNPPTPINTFSSTPQPINRLLMKEWSHMHCSYHRLEMMYTKETLHQNGYPEHCPCPSVLTIKEEKADPRARITIPYIQGVSEAATRTLSGFDVQVHRKTVSHPKDQISDEDKSNGITV